MPFLFVLLNGGVCDLINFNLLAPWIFAWNVMYVTFKPSLVIDGWGISGEIALSWWSLDSLMISQYWVGWWLGAVRQQAITWAYVDPDLCRHMASLGHNELNSLKWKIGLFLIQRQAISLTKGVPKHRGGQLFLFTVPLGTHFSWILILI